ncbi:MAG TPA: phosphatase PAP2 family protein [Candidatus Dormibacteraeota bacterium]|nr:phosphatase PAP2 family protein [Candidatus Dormibacteraeota bacterium]
MPTVDKLLPRLLAIVALSVAFVAMTMAITAGWFNTLDIQVAEEMHSLWQESLHPLFQLIAELGGFELTTILMVGLFFYLWRGRFGADALVIAAFAGAVALEILYKSLLFHPGPPHSLSHSDGPSVSELLPRGALGNSFPSGHMVRAVVAYGLIAFVIRSLTPSRLLRAFVAPVAIAVIVLVAFDRLYLDVHWESDVIGGLLLGGIALLAATVWLDRPRKAEN